MISTKQPPGAIWCVQVIGVGSGACRETRYYHSARTYKRGMASLRDKYTRGWLPQTFMLVTHQSSAKWNSTTEVL